MRYTIVYFTIRSLHGIETTQKRPKGDKQMTKGQRPCPPHARCPHPVRPQGKEHQLGPILQTHKERQ